MLKLYISAAIAAAIFFAYLAGGQIAKQQCRAQNIKTAQVAQNKLIETKRKINAETNNTGSNDIRIWLRAKYTIND